MKKQSGFTLIELVIVVVILGFLAVTALPKFLDLTDQAKQANIEGMAGGFATGVSLVRSQWEAEGRPKDASDRNSVAYDGITVLLTAEDTNTGIRPGYIVGLTDGAGLGGGFDSENCVEIWNTMLQQPPRITDDINVLNNNEQIDYFVGQSSTGVGALCHYYLKESLNKGASGYVSPANVTTVGKNFTYQPATSSVLVYVNP